MLLSQYGRADELMHSNTILSSRRSYNRFVADEMMEDFALRFTAKRARRWGMGWVANTALGTVSFLVLEALGGAITLSFGVTNALWAILMAVFVVMVSGLPICYYAARDGVDIDLLTRGAGFGYIGSTITSLLYASFTFIFFALEAAIMAMALQLSTGVPLWVGYILSAVVVIPLVTHGISRIGRFQQWSQPLWLALQLVPLWFVFTHPDSSLQQWLSFEGVNDRGMGGFSLAAFGAASAVLLSLVAQIGEQVDFLRFLPKPDRHTRRRWLTALLLGGPGWIIPGALKLLLGSYLAYWAVSAGVPAQVAADPAHMYQQVFSLLSDSPALVLLLVTLFVALSQIKINLANAYAGSLAWSNFFSRLTHSHPGRVVWVVFNVAIALLLMLLGVYQALEATLQIYSVLVLAWIGSIVADLVINKPLGLSPRQIEFKRSRLYDINPVGIGSMVIASLVGIYGHMHWLGDTVAALASIIAFFLPFITVPAIALLTRSRFYLIATPAQDLGAAEAQCGVCELRFEREDMSYCPAYQKPICSLCCSLEARCGNRCRNEGTWRTQIRSVASRYLSPQWVARLSAPLAQFLSLWVLIGGLMALIFSLVYSLLPATIKALPAVGAALISAYSMLAILLGVVCWLFILARAGSRQAMQEAQTQSALLSDEVAAHEITYKALQQAKESAESANQAKTRYLAGISHELRTPLNVLMGYAQLLSVDTELSERKREQAATIRRNGEQLVDLIEGLLEISKIEAGRLELQRDEFSLHEFLQQLIGVFRPQAQSKGLQFDCIISAALPNVVATDKQRLRQILNNLLANAIKFTKAGSIRFEISYRNNVAQFKVSDTGVGIADADLHCIFNPFERVRNEHTRNIKGTGLGLTISRALAEVMGGNIDVRSEAGQGSCFTLSLMLNEIRRLRAEPSVPAAQIIGYEGEPRTVLVVDDEPEQRQLMCDLLEPLGFVVLTAAGGQAGLALVAQHSPDLVLLDVSMPDMNGWQVAIALRKRGLKMPIMMISANTTETEHDKMLGQYHNDYLTKPVVIQSLLGKIGQLLQLSWRLAPNEAELNAAEMQAVARRIPEAEHLHELKSWAEIGYLSAVSDKLDKLAQAELADPGFLQRYRGWVQQCDFQRIINDLEELLNEART